MAEIDNFSRGFGLHWNLLKYCREPSLSPFLENHVSLIGDKTTRYVELGRLSTSLLLNFITGNRVVYWVEAHILSMSYQYHNTICIMLTIIYSSKTYIPISMSLLRYASKGGFSVTTLASPPDNWDLVSRKPGYNMGFGFQFSLNQGVAVPCRAGHVNS